jgi:predicted protein tyrosine phosphatase
MIWVAPLRDAARLAQEHAPSHAVRFRSPGERLKSSFEVEPSSVAPAFLTLEFHDTVEQRAGLKCVELSEVAALLSFCQNQEQSRPLLLYCEAGVSRSPAAAYVIACDRSEPGNERRLATELRAAAPFCTPNARLIALGDQYLQRGGAMVRAIAALGRGVETCWGRPFELKACPRQG